MPARSGSFERVFRGSGSARLGVGVFLGRWQSMDARQRQCVPGILGHHGHKYGLLAFVNRPGTLGRKESLVPCFPFHGAAQSHGAGRIDFKQRPQRLEYRIIRSIVQSGHAQHLPDAHRVEAAWDGQVTCYGCIDRQRRQQAHGQRARPCSRDLDKINNRGRPSALEASAAKQRRENGSGALMARTIPDSAVPRDSRRTPQYSPSDKSDYPCRNLNLYIKVVSQSLLHTNLLI